MMTVIDWDKCDAPATVDAYRGEPNVFAARFAETRASLDYTYHINPTLQRQELQDAIISGFVEQAKRWEVRPWVLFTAGPMGAGKSYTLRALSRKGLFPLSKFVLLDSDAFKYELPEMQSLVRANCHSAASKTHKESGMLVEIAMYELLCRGTGIVVDGTLRDVEWHRGLIHRIRKKFPSYRFGILQVKAPPELVLERALSRQKDTGRAVPESKIMLSIEQVPKSVAALREEVEFVSVIENAGSEPTLREPSCWGEFEQVWLSGPPNPTMSRI